MSDPRHTIAALESYLQLEAKHPTFIHRLLSSTTALDLDRHLLPSQLGTTFGSHQKDLLGGPLTSPTTATTAIQVSSSTGSSPLVSIVSMAPADVCSFLAVLGAVRAPRLYRQLREGAAATLQTHDRPSADTDADSGEAEMLSMPDEPPPIARTDDIRQRIEATRWSLRDTTVGLGAAAGGEVPSTSDPPSAGVDQATRVRTEQDEQAVIERRRRNSANMKAFAVVARELLAKGVARFGQAFQVDMAAPLGADEGPAFSLSEGGKEMSVPLRRPHQDSDETDPFGLYSSTPHTQPPAEDLSATESVSVPTARLLNLSDFFVRYAYMGLAALDALSDADPPLADPADVTRELDAWRGLAGGPLWDCQLFVAQMLDAAMAHQCGSCPLSFIKDCLTRYADLTAALSKADILSTRLRGPSMTPQTKDLERLNSIAAKAVDRAARWYASDGEDDGQMMDVLLAFPDLLGECTRHLGNATRMLLRMSVTSAAGDCGVCDKVDGLHRSLVALHEGFSHRYAHEHLLYRMHIGDQADVLSTSVAAINGSLCH
mmetsp:Transcript_28520/g.82179  ORF Transcript_28520/g.82179 Transcript_28520/m.82179 type:complete len:545 (-) Transcript_28520:664-2298(-)